MPVRALFVALLLLASSAAHAQPRYGLSPDAYSVFAKWMTSTCTGDEEAQWRALLRRYRAELIPAFRRALAEGPPQDAIATVRRDADVRYRSLAALPASELRVEGIDPQTLARLARAPRQGFVDDQVQRY